jgi:hypothetical protein
MSPRSTFQNCGNSSRLDRRRKVPQPRDALSVREKSALRVALVAHAPKFECENRSAHVARTLLAKQSWTPHLQPYDKESPRPAQGIAELD